MDAVERHVTLPWLGAEVVLDPTPGGVGEVVDDDGDVSRVQITLVPVEGGTRVHVVEELAPEPALGLRAEARAGATEAWSHRLLHLEALLLVAVAVRG